MLISVVPALICITLHELSHGYVAYRLGDDTAKRAGRLTLNPIRHIDIMGLVMMVIFRIGWAKPVPVDMRKFQNPKQGMAVTALAGPVANVIICAVFLFIYGLAAIPLDRAGSVGSYISEMLLITAYISAALAIFNIIPIPPLDGSKVLGALLPERSYLKLMYFERYGMIFLVALIFIMNRLPIDPLGTATEWVFDKLSVFARWGFDIAYSIAS